MPSFHERLLKKQIQVDAEAQQRRTESQRKQQLERDKSNSERQSILASNEYRQVMQQFNSEDTRAMLQEVWKKHVGRKSVWSNKTPVETNSAQEWDNQTAKLKIVRWVTLRQDKERSREFSIKAELILHEDKTVHVRFFAPGAERFGQDIDNMHQAVFIEFKTYDELCDWIAEKLARNCTLLYGSIGAYFE